MIGFKQVKTQIHLNMFILKNVFLTKLIAAIFALYEKKTLFARRKKFFSKLFFSQYCIMKNMMIK